MYAVRLRPKFAPNAYTRARAGYVINVLVNMSAAKKCFFQWLTRPELECADTLVMANEKKRVPST